MAKLPAGCNVDSSPMSRFYQTLKDQSLTVPCSGFDFYVNAHETTVSLRCAHQIDMKTTVYSHMIEGSSKPECLAEYIVKTFREQCAMLHGGYASVGLIPYALAAPSNSFHPVAAKKYAVWGPELTDPLTVKAQLSDYWASVDETPIIPETDDKPAELLASTEAILDEIDRVLDTNVIERMREILAEGDVAMEPVKPYTLADAMREGSKASEQCIGGWTGGEGETCALSAAMVAVRARGIA